MFNITVSILIGYFFGSFQSSYILGRLVKKIDIRKYGTSNAGASNATMVLGFKYGILTFLLDVTKIIITYNLLYILFKQNNLSHMGALSAILGHNFPFYLNFKGGKGVASFLGFFFCIDVFFGFSLSFMIFLFALISNYISLAGIFLYIIGPFIVWFKIRNFYILIYSIIVCLIGIYLHRTNIEKILNGKEKKLREFIYEKLNKQK